MPRKDPSFDSYLDQQIDEYTAESPECPDCTDLQKEVDTLQEELDTFRQTKWWSALEEQGNINKDLQDTITGLKTMFEELQGRFDRQAEVLESYAEERMRLEKELEKAAVIIAQLLTKP